MAKFFLIAYIESFFVKTKQYSVFK